MSLQISSHAFSTMCRFCGNSRQGTIDIFASGLAETALRYFPLTLQITDPLPGLCCTDCMTMILRVDEFSKRAITVQGELFRRHQQTSTAVAAAHANASKTTNSKQLVRDALLKLQSTSLVVKRIGSKQDIKHESVASVNIKAEPLDIKQELVENYDEHEMKVEVLDEAFEQVLAGGSGSVTETDTEYTNLETLEDYYGVAMEMGVADEAENVDPDDKWDDSVMKGSKREASTQRNRRPAKKGTVINLVDPCNYACLTCKGKFSNFETLQQHIEQHGPCKLVHRTCEQCGKVCETRRALYQHRNTHAPKVSLICDKCGKVYTNSFNLENHKSQVHEESFDELGYLYKCCDMDFATRKQLDAHIAQHTKDLNLLCDACGKRFTTHKALRSHHQTHMNVRPFACTFCSKAFRTKLLLVQHIHVHTGVKTFNCDICLKGFAKKESLRKHYKKMHPEHARYSWTSVGEKMIVKTGKMAELLPRQPMATE